MNPNSLLVRWAGGFTTVTDSAAVTAAGGLVRQAFFSVPDAQSEGAAESLATQELARLQGGSSIVAEPVFDVGTSPAPYVDWFVGDSIPVTQYDGTGTDTVKVSGITVTEGTGGDDAGLVSAVPELQSPLQTRAERAEQQLRRAQPGLSAEVATAARSDDPFARRPGKLALEELTWGFDGQLRDKGPEMRFRRLCRVTFLDVTLSVPGSTATALQVLKNGVAISTLDQNGVIGNSSLLIPAGVYHAVAFIRDVVCSEMDTIQFDVTTAGTDAETMSVQLLGAVAERTAGG